MLKIAIFSETEKLNFTPVLQDSATPRDNHFTVHPAGRFPDLFYFLFPVRFHPVFRPVSTPVSRPVSGPVSTPLRRVPDGGNVSRLAALDPTVHSVRWRSHPFRSPLLRCRGWHGLLVAAFRHSQALNKPGRTARKQATQKKDSPKANNTFGLSCDKLIDKPLAYLT